MIRPILQEIALFLAPFLVYWVYLLATRGRVSDPMTWGWRVWGWLSVAGFILIIISFIIIAHFSGVPPGSTYRPAHMENGKLVPGSN